MFTSVTGILLAGHPCQVCNNLGHFFASSGCGLSTYPFISSISFVSCVVLLGDMNYERNSDESSSEHSRRALACSWDTPLKPLIELYQALPTRATPEFSSIIDRVFLSIPSFMLSHHNLDMHVSWNPTCRRT